MLEFWFNPKRFELRSQACSPVMCLLCPLAFRLYRRRHLDAVRVIEP